MRIQNQLQISNKIKKSHILLFGSFLIFVGFISLSCNYFIKMKDEVFSEMKIAMMDEDSVDENVNVVEDVPKVDNLPEQNNVTTNNTSNQAPVVNYDKYLGVLEIPRIGLKRGFYNLDSKYNNIEYNVSMVRGSTLPDVVNGNLILMAHSGDAYISYFAYLYRLKIGNYAYVTYKGNKYKYQIVNIYTVPKNGSVKIIRNYNRTTLTLITCTKDDDTTQTVYIAELV